MASNMNENSSALKETRNKIAVRHGIPPIGSRMKNQYGIEWLVEGHIFLSTLASIARHGVDCANLEDPQDLYPVLTLQNASPLLLNFVSETDRCTSKSIILVDTMPSLRPRSAHPGSYWVDGQTNPYNILLFLDAAHLHESILAHEIGHIWIDLVEDCEDYRTLKDLSNTARVTHWTNIQSFVLDKKVNEVIRERGFDVSVIDGHVEEALSSLSLAILSGYRPPNPGEAAFLAMTLASAMLDHETGAADTLQSLDVADMVIQRDLPDVYELACQLAASVRRHDYSNREGIRKAIDECASLSFNFAGENFNLDRDLVEEAPNECYEDKYPNNYTGLPVAAKLEIGKLMASMKIPAQSQYRINYSLNGSATIQFCEESGVWTPPTPLHHPYRFPHDVSSAGYNRSIQKGNITMNKPISTNKSITHHTMPTIGTNRGSRTYAPGLAVFLSRVRLAEQLGGEHPYSYAFNNPVNYIDPSGMKPPDQPIQSPRDRYDDICRCNECARGIARAWIVTPTPQHFCNPFYIHCMACCILTRMLDERCAMANQDLQIRLDPIPKDPKIAVNRRTACGEGILFAIESGTCHQRCYKKYPDPGSWPKDTIIRPGERYCKAHRRQIPVPVVAPRECWDNNNNRLIE